VADVAGWGRYEDKGWAPRSFSFSVNWEMS